MRLAGAVAAGELAEPLPSDRSRDVALALSRGFELTGRFDGVPDAADVTEAAPRRPRAAAPSLSDKSLSVELAASRLVELSRRFMRPLDGVEAPEAVAPAPVAEPGARSDWATAAPPRPRRATA